MNGHEVRLQMDDPPGAGRRALIIGSRGLIGCALAGRLVSHGYQVHGVDSDRAAESLAPWRQATHEWRRRLTAGSSQVVLDVREHTKVQEFIDRVKPHAIVYLAALLASQSREHPDEARAVQVEGLANVLQSASAVHPTPHVVLASSSYVFGHFEGRTVNDSSELAPIDEYGRAKAEAEVLLAESGLPATVLRPAAVYGIGDPRSRYVTVSVEAAAAGRPLVYEYPDFSADFTHVDDVADAFVRALEVPAAVGGTFNITREEPRRNADVIDILLENDTGLKSVVTAEEIPAYVPRRGLISCRGAHETLGWTARLGLREGVLNELRLAQSVLSPGSADG